MKLFNTRFKKISNNTKLISVGIIIILLTCIILIIKKQNLEKISVIILSYNRVHNLHKSIPIISTYKNIDEIIILHGNEDNYEELKYPKVKNYKDYKNNEIYGASRRFFGIKYVRNKYVMLLDDDILPDETFINTSLEKAQKKYTIFGKYTRLCTNEKYENNSNDFNIILTGLSIFDKQIIEQYMEHPDGFKKYKEWFIKYKGNCEDIALNLFVKKIIGISPEYVKEGSYKELDISNGYSSDSNHYKIRNNFCKLYAD